jgi:hypothetical protein
LRARTFFVPASCLCVLRGEFFFLFAAQTHGTAAASQAIDRTGVFRPAFLAAEFHRCSCEKFKHQALEKKRKSPS